MRIGLTGAFFRPTRWRGVVGMFSRQLEQARQGVADQHDTVGRSRVGDNVFQVGLQVEAGGEDDLGLSGCADISWSRFEPVGIDARLEQSGDADVVATDFTGNFGENGIKGDDGE
jgi:hypothetical protein